MAEWSKAAVLKTVDLKGSVGSNPTSSANSKPPTEKLGVFVCEIIVCFKELKDKKILL